MTFSGPLAIIKVNGQAIGKMKTVNYNENVNRGRVGGLGTLNPLEVPALAWDGTLSCDSYLIDFKNTMFFTLSKIIDFILLPITWLIALTCLTMFNKKVKFKRVAGFCLLGILILGSNT